MEKALLWYPYSRTKGKLPEGNGGLLSAKDWRRRDR